MHLIVTVMVVVLSLASLVLIAIESGKEQIKTLRIWPIIRFCVPTFIYNSFLLNIEKRWILN